MRSTLFWDITQHSVAFPYRRFGTTYQSNPQESIKVGVFIDSTVLGNPLKLDQT